MTGARSFSVNRDSKSDGLAIYCSSQHEMQITRMKTKPYCSARLFETGFFRSHVPFTTYPPVVQIQCWRKRILHRLVWCDGFLRCEMSGTVVTDVGFWGFNLLFVRRGLYTFIANTRNRQR